MTGRDFCWARDQLSTRSGRLFCVLLSERAGTSKRILRQWLRWKEWRNKEKCYRGKHAEVEHCSEDEGFRLPMEDDGELVGGGGGNCSYFHFPQMELCSMVVVLVSCLSLRLALLVYPGNEGGKIVFPFNIGTSEMGKTQMETHLCSLLCQMDCFH